MRNDVLSEEVAPPSIMWNHSIH